MRVGLFDSGIGGLTVLKVLMDKYPSNDYIYYGDTKNVPYGDKSKEELLDLARSNINFLISKNVDMIIVACGTVSSNCLDILVKEYDIPIISIVKPTIDYLNNSMFNNIGVIATHATINSHIFKNSINKKVYEIETSKLVPIIESNNYSNIEEVLHSYLDDYKDKIDVLVLGCTHYPLLIDYIKRILPDNVIILNMANQIVMDNEGNSSIEIYYSKIDEIIVNNTMRIIGRKYDILKG